MTETNFVSQYTYKHVYISMHSWLIQWAFYGSTVICDPQDP